MVDAVHKKAPRGGEALFSWSGRQDLNLIPVFLILHLVAFSIVNQQLLKKGFCTKGK